MEAIILVAQSLFWGFLAGWMYGKNEQLLSLGVFVLGLGTVLIRNPFPTSDDRLYPIIAIVLVLIGIVIMGRVGFNRYVE